MSRTRRQSVTSKQKSMSSLGKWEKSKRMGLSQLVIQSFMSEWSNEDTTASKAVLISRSICRHR